MDMEQVIEEVSTPWGMQTVVKCQQKQSWKPGAWIDFAPTKPKDGPFHVIAPIPANGKSMWGATNE